MARPKSNGPYAPLSATYYYDDAILEAGERAELLFVRLLAFLSSSSSDGYVTDRQLEKVVGTGLSRVPDRVRQLSSAGLISVAPGGYVVRSWSKWNRSAEEIGKYLKRDRERKASNHAGISDNSDRNPSGIRTDSAPQITTHQITTHQSNVSAENRPDVSRLCDILADRIEANGSKKPTVSKAWLDAARLLLDADKRPLGEALSLIEWCQKEEFWRANILSMPKFREKYDQLRLQKQKPVKQTPESRARATVTLATELIPELKGVEA